MRKSERAWGRYHVIIFAICFIGVPAWASGLDPVQYVQNQDGPGCFPIVQKATACGIYVDSSDWPGVIRAAGDLQADIQRVTGRSLALTKDSTALGATEIIIGTLGKSPVIDALVKSGKIDVSPIAGKWESFFLQTVSDPMPGVASALVIAGSDKRGTIFGIYDLSEQIGVSPWYWWADATPAHQDQLFVRPGKFVQGEPSVKYRGIFLNDESPDLTNWVREKYGNVAGMNGVANYDSRFYARVFELLLRLKANYLWPAMWNNAFNEDDPENPRLADEYGIVMGTSHQEPMLRAQKEWDRRHRQSWNYFTDAQTLSDFWREGIRRNKNFESILTLGLRGANDTPMIPNATAAQSIDLLRKIIDAQRKMIGQEINPDVTKVPQLWCPYKEVLDYYNAGLRVPDDVTILWTDDNWGNIRRLPRADERARPGGAGIYYHFDYVGGPRNYKWINTNPIAKIWEQMSLAKEYGADRIWIVNVGHLKGLEFPIEYFLRLAWNTDQWNNSNIEQYTQAWSQREFGPENAGEIAHLITQYTRFNGRRKPELLSPTTYSLTNYAEADNVVSDFNALAAEAADVVYSKLPAAKRDAFYELVQFPVKACAQVNELNVDAGKNTQYARQGRAAANDLADSVQTMFKADADLMDHFNHTLGDGRWDHFMDQVHIGYTGWQDPPRNVMPRVSRIDLPAAAAMGVAIDGSDSAWAGDSKPVDTNEAVLPQFDSLSQRKHFIDVFNRGQNSFAYSMAAGEPWIIIDKPAGSIEKEKRIWISVDWNKAPKGSSTGNITVAGAGGENVGVKINALNPTEITRDSLIGFAESEGCVSIEPERFTKNIPAGNVRWEKIEDYGPTLSAMTPRPALTPSAMPPGHSPCLEYHVYLFDAGPLNVLTTVAPTSNFIPGKGLSLAESFDDQPPKIVTILTPTDIAQNGNREWETAVRDGCRIIKTPFTLGSGGYHDLKIWMVDPGVVVEKLVIDFGGTKAGYLGPPESYFRGGGASGNGSGRGR